MCGICGFFHYGNSAGATWDGPALVAAMTGTIVHRGPDDDGFFVEGPVALGMRRLSIVDVSGGHQPIFNEDESLVIVYNGEIYNYLSLREELQARGHRFRTRSDTEVILHLYEEYGARAIERLDGIFAFCIYDRRREQLFLARDRVGVKPLYYVDLGGTIAFASEIKALLEIPGLAREVDEDALGLYLTLRYVPAPLTMFRDVRKLLPAHWLRANAAERRTERYWSPRYEPKVDLGEREAVDRLAGLVRDSVRRQMQSDPEVRVGAFLSGGVDSSAIVGLMAEAAGPGVPTFSVGFRDGGRTNELDAARAFATRVGAEHHEVSLDTNDFMSYLPDAVWHQDEPVADAAAIPLHFLSECARDHVKVVLTGEGADELFAGYHRHLGEYAASALGPIPRLARLLGASRVLERLIRSKKARRGLGGLVIDDPDRRLLWWLSAAPAAVKGALLGISPDAAEADVARLISERLAPSDARSNFDRLAQLDLEVWLPDDLLMKKDKMGMSASIEARVPFLDNAIIDFATRLPVGLRMRGLRGKRILREAMRPLLPAEILRRPKLGFVVPTDRWLKGTMRPFVHEMLLDHPATAGYFARGSVPALLREFEAGAPHGQAVFSLLWFELWHRRFIDRQRGLPDASTRARRAASALALSPHPS